MKLLLTFLCSLLLLTNISAQAPKEKALLWKVSGKQLKSPSYLYGTYHLLCPEDLKFPKKVLNALKASNKIYLELDFDDPELMQKMGAHVLMKNDESLKNLLSDSIFQITSNAFSNTTGMSLEMFVTLKPMLISTMLYPSVIKCELSSPEQEFVKLAKEQNKVVEGLETVEQQMEVIDQIPYSEQAKMLTDYLFEIEKFKIETFEILKLYKEGNLEELQKQMNSPNQSYTKYLDGMLLQRNRNWIPIIDKQVTEAPVFIAVGAGHLAGEEGVISLLRKLGYTVSPL
jgi:uncharacterized protein YbaP (TraB family)